MKRDECPRKWEADAVDDGRFGQAEKLSFERHLATCADCRQEAQSIAELRASMKDVPILTRTPLQTARARAQILRRVNSQMMEGRSSARSWLPVLAVVGAFLLGIFGVRHSLRVEKQAAAPLARFEIEGNAGLSWSEQSEPAVRRIVLKSGVASIHVSHLVAGQRFLAILPDGEIEVHGTRFVVTIADQRTERVDVTEGVVSLRIAGKPEQSLTAGMHWVREAPATTALDPQAPLPAASSLANGASVPIIPSAPSAGGSAHAVVQLAASDQPSDSAEAQLSTFAAAMQAFSQGNYTLADARFAQFQREAPADPRCEDASFLRAVAHSRVGDAPGTRALVEQYLSRYPHGLRRQDAERLLPK